MRKLALGAILVLVSVAVGTLLASSVLAQTKPEFRLGFKALADQIPLVAGEPLENEHWGANGDSLQQTTTGLMVWRKADNWTAFTNGSRTWINGPNGVKERANEERFEWESVATPTPQATPTQTPAPTSTLIPATPTPTVAPCFLSDSAVTMRLTRGRDWAWQAEGTIRNTCPDPMDAEVNVVVYRTSAGPPIMDAPSVFVRNLPPGQSRSISTRIPTVRDYGGYRCFVVSALTDNDVYATADVGATKMLEFSPHLANSIFQLKRVDGGQWLLRVAAENGVRIRSETTDIGVLGYYDPKTRIITLDARLEAYSAWVRAATLAHELQHAADDAVSRLIGTRSECYRNEEAAFRRQAQVWGALWQSQLPEEPTVVHSMLNDVSRTVERDPVGFAMELEVRYYGQCSKYPN